MTPHGSASTYTNHKCRCDDCRAAWAASVRRMRANRHARREQATLLHGRYSTYQNWGCRCDECVAANSAATRRWREARQARSAS